MHSGFFRFKHSVTIAEQEKLHMEDFWGPSGNHPLKKIPSDHGDMVTRYDVARRVQTIFFFISNSNREFSSHHFGPFPD